MTTTDPQPSAETLDDMRALLAKAETSTHANMRLLGLLRENAAALIAAAEQSERWKQLFETANEQCDMLGETMDLTRAEYAERLAQVEAELGRESNFNEYAWQCFNDAVAERHEWERRAFAAAEEAREIAAERDRLREELEDERDTHQFAISYACDDARKERVGRLHAEQERDRLREAMRWRSVEDELPLIGVWVLVSSPEFSTPMMARYYPSRGLFISHAGPLFKATHWQHLPQRPEGEPR